MAVSPRPPIVAVMGHIDHGKSSLLDYIRKANVTAGEAGGITQHVSAYVAEHEHEGKVRKITFLDTPGHEAFKALRARGAAAADVAILVIAGDEGVKPQTKEAWSEIVSAGIPFVVAFTKMDKNGADIERVKISALEEGIYLEGVGGDIPFTGVSSKTGEGIPELLDLVLLTADLAEPTGDPGLPASGFVLEASQDAKRGISATLIIKNGTLETGTFAVSGTALSPIRFIDDFRGVRLPSAGPSEPVAVAGWNELPSAGMPFSSLPSKKEAEKVVQEAKTAKPSASVDVSVSDGKVSVPVVLKADVSGSLEAVALALSHIEHLRASVKIISSGIGAVSEGDIKSAVSGGAFVVAFHTSVPSSMRELADRSNVTIESFDIIYDLVKRVEDIVKERAPRVKEEATLGEAKVLKSFSVSGVKQVLGASFLSGSLSVGSQVRVMRRGVELGRGRLTNLQQARSDVKEIHTEGEFGLQIEARAEALPGDVLSTFHIVES